MSRKGPLLQRLRWPLSGTMKLPVNGKLWALTDLWCREVTGTKRARADDLHAVGSSACKWLCSHNLLISRR